MEEEEEASKKAAFFAEFYRNVTYPERGYEDLAIISGRVDSKPFLSESDEESSSSFLNKGRGKDHPPASQPEVCELHLSSRLRKETPSMPSGSVEEDTYLATEGLTDNESILSKLHKGHHTNTTPDPNGKMRRELSTTEQTSNQKRKYRLGIGLVNDSESSAFSTAPQSEDEPPSNRTLRSRSTTSTPQKRTKGLTSEVNPPAATLTSDSKQVYPASSTDKMDSTNTISLVSSSSEDDTRSTTAKEPNKAKTASNSLKVKVKSWSLKRTGKYEPKSSANTEEKEKTFNGDSMSDSASGDELLPSTYKRSPKKNVARMPEKDGIPSPSGGRKRRTPLQRKFTNALEEDEVAQHGLEHVPTFSQATTESMLSGSSTESPEDLYYDYSSEDLEPKSRKPKKPNTPKYETPVSNIPEPDIPKPAVSNPVPDDVPGPRRLRPQSSLSNPLKEMANLLKKGVLPPSASARIRSKKMASPVTETRQAPETRKPRQSASMKPVPKPAKPVVTRKRQADKAPLTQEVREPKRQKQKQNSESPSEPLPVPKEKRPLEEVHLADEVLETKRQKLRSESPKPAPRDVFKNLFFYFFEEKDECWYYHFPKCMRMGATLVKDLNGPLTHFIVPGQMHWDQVCAGADVSQLPPSVAVVTDAWLERCYLSGRPIDRIPRELFPDGHPESMEGQTAVTRNISSSSGPPALVRASSTRSQVSNPFADPKLLKLVKEHELKRQVAPTKDYDPPELTKGEASKTRPKDELDKAIEFIKTNKMVAFDDNTETQHPRPDPEAESSEDSERGKTAERPKAGRKSAAGTSWQDAFTCMQKNDGKTIANNPNQRTIKLLLEMASYYERTKDMWRVLGYRKAISQLKKQSTKIRTKEQALALPSIGERLAAKIEEIAQTDHLQRLDNVAQEPNDAALQLFTGIYGVGYAQAMSWIAQGYRTLEDLATNATLSTNQKIGLDHYEDFKARIPRAEVEDHGRFVEKVLHEVSEDLQCAISGSYRRGAATCGDVDFLVTAPDASLDELHKLVIETVIPKLWKADYLKTALAVTRSHAGSKWHGAACLPELDPPGVWRRVDFLLVPWDEWGAALLYFTGNDIFNRSMRLLASKKGMRLNQHGLYKDVFRGPGREKLNEGILIESQNEKRIFELLGVPWRPPEHRIA